MRIIHLIEATATGTLSMAASLANAQNKDGHEVYIIYSVRPETPSELHGLFHPGISLIQIQMHSYYEKFTCMVKIRKNLIMIRPKKVFMHSSFAGFLGRISALFALKGADFLYIPHCISFLRKDVGIFKKSLFIILEWIGSLKGSDYVACSKSEQAAIMAFIPFRKCHLVENALDFSSIPFLARKSVHQRRNIIITVGQIRPQKGPDDFAEIALSMKSIYPEIEFIWVGDGDAESRHRLQLSGVTVTGWKTKDEVWKLFEAARIYLSTSRWEGMPISLIEAHFAGLPVIASSCPGNIDVIEHGETGWLFNTPNEAVEMIEFSLKSPVNSQRISDTALLGAQQRFNLERYFEEINNLIP